MGIGFRESVHHAVAPYLQVPLITFPFGYPGRFARPVVRPVYPVCTRLSVCTARQDASQRENGFVTPQSALARGIVHPKRGRGSYHSGRLQAVQTTYCLRQREAI